MNELTVFQNKEFGRLRTAEIEGEVWFVGKDVARALGYGNPRDALSRHVDAEDKGVVKHDTPGGNQQITIINESGLYSLVLSSKRRRPVSSNTGSRVKSCPASASVAGTAMG